MADVDVYIDLADETIFIGVLRRYPGSEGETVTFGYSQAWLEHEAGFSIEPAIMLTSGIFPTPHGQRMFGAFGDSAPDTWRRFMQRAERRKAAREGRSVRTLLEIDYLLGVHDETRMGALRFAWHKPCSVGYKSTYSYD